jgi:SecD/SecF fusion protein
MYPEVKTFGYNNQVKITTKYLIDSKELSADAIVSGKLDDGLVSIGDYEVMSSQKVGPTIADDIKVSALWSIMFSLLIIFLYILLRFRKWQFSLGAVAAVFHDVLIVLSIFSLFYGILPFSLEIDQAFIAALLTIIGYSLNDTVVVFDRIREHMNIFKKKEFNSLVNNALNSTLSRTVNTSLTTFFVLLVIFLFGGEVIRGFMFALMVGVIVGTYSSLFVASPIMVDTVKKSEEDKK